MADKLSFKKNSIYEEGYGIVPKKPMRDKRLSPEAKAIYAYICSFAGAGNSAFPGADLMMAELQMSEKRFYKHRKLLIEYGYIEIVKNRRENRRDNNTYLISQHGSFERVQNESVHFESVQNEGPIINSININSFNNNSSSTGASYIKFFNSNFGHLISQYERELLESYIHDGMEPEVITMALKEAVKNNVRTVRYVQSILNRWVQNKLTTVEAVNADKNNFKQKASKESRANAGAYKVL